MLRWPGAYDWLQLVERAARRAVEWEVMMLQVCILPREQMVEALAAPPAQARILVIVGVHDGEMLTLVRADGVRATIPLSAFRPSGDGTAPDFNRFELDDYGHTIVFGDYEAAAGYALERATTVP